MAEEALLNLTPDPKVLIALTHTHIQPLDALCELIDNAIDSFSAAKLQGVAIEYPSIRIDLPKASDIDANKGVVRVSDNGPGLTVDSAEKALRAGFSSNNPYDTLGLFGMGFNISTGKIGSVTHFYSAREDHDLAIDVIIDLNKINETKDYKVTAYQIPKESLSHGTIIEISNWWPNGNDNRGFVKTLVSYGTKKIREELGRRYATILRKQEIRLFVNEVECDAYEHCIWGDNRYVTRQKHGKIPAVFRFDQVLYTQKKCLHCGASLESFQTECPACSSHEIRTLEERITGWVGIQRFDDLSEYGIDLIRNGRAIRISEKSAFFEFVDEFQKTIKDYPVDSNFGRIVGEVQLNHVPVDFMKQDFQRSSPEWHRAITFLRGESSLQPMQPGADSNNSPVFKLFQGYRKVKVAGTTDMYMGVWDTVKEEPKRISRDIEKEYYDRFLHKEPGYYDDSEWWKRVEEADKKPVKKLPLCKVCGCQNLEEAEVCIGCQAILRGKNCVSCGEYIPLSAKVCPKCGKSQDPEIVKPWVCSVCGCKNAPEVDACSACGSQKGTENFLSREYLLKHSNKDDTLSIQSCSIVMTNGQNSSPLSVDVYITTDHIHSNTDTKAIPIITEKLTLDSICVFVDITHRMFKNCQVKVEQMVASEIAEHIYLLNKSIGSSSGKHSIPYISWQIIEKYWADEMEDNSEELMASITSVFDSIRENLVLSGNTDLPECFDMLNNEQTKEMVNNMINAGEDISKISSYRDNAMYIKYVPASFLVTLFGYKPEFFFDGKVWDEAYSTINSSEEVKLFAQERTKVLYKGCLDDVLYYLTYKNQSEFVLQKTKLAVQMLKQRVKE